MLQTVSSPAPPSTESVPPSGATAQPVVHDDQNGQDMHVVKPEKPVDTTDAQLESQAVEDSHAAEASTSQTEAAAALKAAIEKEAAVQLALKAELAAAAAKAALQEQLEAAAAAAAASSDDSQVSAPPSAEELVKADTATGKLQQQLHQNKDTMAADQQQNKEAAAQEGRVLKPAAARTEPKTPGAKGRKVPQAANPRNLVFVTAEVCGIRCDITTSVHVHSYVAYGVSCVSVIGCPMLSQRLLCRSCTHPTCLTLGHVLLVMHPYVPC